MSDCIDFQHYPTHALYRPQGKISTDEAIELMANAVRHARECGIEKLLIDITPLTGIDPPDFWQRARMAIRCAEEAQSKVVLAVVAPERLIDQEKIGVHIGRNRGILQDVFTNEQDAVEWLTNPS